MTGQAKGLTVGLIVVAVVIAAIAATRDRVSPAAPAPERAAPAAAPNALQPPARDVPSPTPTVASQLRGRPRQRDVARTDRSHVAYIRAHRLLVATPLTFEGVGFDAAGRTRDGRVRITADGAGLTPSEVRSAYRRLLKRRRDAGRTYHLVISAPKESLP